MKNNEYKIALNPNKKKVKEIQRQLKDNLGYCPCSLIHNKDTKCICKEFRENLDMEECHCGLYIRVHNAN